MVLAAPLCRDGESGLREKSPDRHPASENNVRRLVPDNWRDGVRNLHALPATGSVEFASSEQRDLDIFAPRTRRLKYKVSGTNLPRPSTAWSSPESVLAKSVGTEWCQYNPGKAGKCAACIRHIPNPGQECFLPVHAANINEP
jgi:hypothetical protein